MSDINQLFNQDGQSAMLSLIERVRHLESLEKGASGTGGGIALRIKTVTTTYTVDSTDWTILADASGGGFTISLPAAADVYTADSEEGQFFNIKKIDSSKMAVTVDPDGAETIDGQSTICITIQYDSIQFQSDGTEWHII